MRQEIHRHLLADIRLLRKARVFPDSMEENNGSDDRLLPQYDGKNTKITYTDKTQNLHHYEDET